MGLKDDQKSRTHDEILASAGRILRERGIAGASVAEVMKGAGLTVGGFYAHFASKEALIDEVLRRTAREMRARLFTGLADKAPAERFEAVVRRYLSRLHRDEVAEGCVLPAVVGEVAATAAAQRDAVADAVDHFAAELSAQVRDEALPPARARAFALGMVALLYGGVALARALKGTELSDEVLRACREVARFAQRGATSPK